MTGSSADDPLAAMLNALSRLGRRELEAWLALDLGAQPTPAKRRVAELGALADLLRELTPNPGWTYSTIAQAEYDDRRPQAAPSGETLAERYGNWKRACRAAYALGPRGRAGRDGPHAWPHAPGRGRARVTEYTPDEVIRAVRRCGLELACRPTSTTYMRWYKAKRQLAREHGVDIRIPNINEIYRHFPVSRRERGRHERWRRIVAAAALTDDDLRAAFAKRMRIEQVELTAADELDEATIDSLAKAGVTEASIALTQEGRPGDLRLSQAVLAARALDCSLAYFMHASSERGRPPSAHLCFDHLAYLRRRKEVGVSAARVSEVLSLSPRDARRLALGTYEPTVGQITTLQQILRLPFGLPFAGS